MEQQTIAYSPKKLHDSPFQPTDRGKEAAGDASFVESIKNKGVIVAVCARPIKGGPQLGGHLELVYGHRRKYGAIAANVGDIPVIVKDLTDSQVLEEQIVENIQREDIDPLDEAEQLQKLHSMVPIEEVCARTGKNRSYVYGRLKLCTLVQEARDAYKKGRISASGLLYIARIPTVLQAQAVGECNSVEPKSAREIFDIIQRRYMLRLSEAPFDRGDEALVPEAGSCKACLKRTGNQVDLFSDVKTKDTCTDPACFDAKKAAHWENVKTEAKEKGREVLSDKDARRVLTGAGVQMTSGYVDLDAPVPDDAKKRTFGALLGKRVEVDAVPITIARDAQTGKVHQLVPVEAVRESLPKKLVAETKAGDKSSDKEAMVKAAGKVVGVKLLESFEEKGAARDFDKAVWLALVDKLLDNGAEGVDDILVARGLLTKRHEDKELKEAEEKFRKGLERKTASELRGLWLSIYLLNESRYFCPTKKGLGTMERVAVAMRLDPSEMVREEVKRASTAASNGKKAVAAKETTGDEAAE